MLAPLSVIKHNGFPQLYVTYHKLLENAIIMRFDKGTFVIYSQGEKLLLF